MIYSELWHYQFFLMCCQLEPVKRGTILSRVLDMVDFCWELMESASECDNGQTTSANPLFQDSTYSNYRNSTVFDSAYSIRCHRVPVPREHSSDIVRLQYVLHKVTSQNFTKFHRLPHPHPHSTTTTVITRTTPPLPTTPPQRNHT